jgi:hypothetical protein
MRGGSWRGLAGKTFWEKCKNPLDNVRGVWYYDNADVTGASFIGDKPNIREKPFGLLGDAPS